MKRLEKLIENEKREKKAQEEKEVAAKKAKLVKNEKKKLRLERKRKEEEKWKTIRWVVKYLDENIHEFLEAVEVKEKSEKNKWEKMKRFERIEALKSEQQWAERRARLDLEKKLPPGKRYHLEQKSDWREQILISQLVKN